MTSQNHFTLSFPLKSPAGAKAVAEQLPPLMPSLFEAETSGSSPAATTNQINNLGLFRHPILPAS